MASGFNRKDHIRGTVEGVTNSPIDRLLSDVHSKDPGGNLRGTVLKRLAERLHKESKIVQTSNLPITQTASGSKVIPTKFESRDAKFLTHAAGRRSPRTTSRLGVMSMHDFGFQSEVITPDIAARKFQDLGFNTNTGLLDLINLLHSRNIKMDLTGGQLRAFGGGLREEAIIPLFANNLAAGDQSRVEALKRQGFSDGKGEFMFKGGSVSSVTAEVAELAGTESNADKLLFQNTRTFSDFVYSELKTNIERSISSGQGIRLKDNINQVLGIQEDVLGVENMFGKSVQESVGYVDALQYAGRQKLGRHHLGHSQQIMLEVTNEKLIRLLRTEQAAGQRLKTANAMHGGIAAGDREMMGKLRKSHQDSKQQVIDHLKRIEAVAGSAEAQNVKRLNLALASQSGEWLFQENSNTVNDSRQAARLIIKMTAGDIKNLSILPGQDIFEKGRQFQLSRGVMSISDIEQLPAAVARIMGFDSREMSALKGDAAALQRSKSADVSIGLSRRTLGAQFLNPDINEALFGDSGAMMSQNLMEALDYDPISGHSRHTITSKIKLKQIESSNATLQLRGVLRTDLASTIIDHVDRFGLDATDTVRFQQGSEIALQAHARREKTARSIGFSMGADGRVIIGENSMNAEDVKMQDLQHANDVLRDVQNRGMDPTKVDITGVRFHKKTGELELIMSQRQSEVLTADSGYIFGGHRVSIGKILSGNRTKKLSNLLGSTDEEREYLRNMTRKTGMVFGELGIGKNVFGAKPDKTAYGFHTTLLTNLAEIISEKAGDDVSHAAVKALTKSMGGEATKVSIKDKSKIQFTGLGTRFERIEDADFRGELNKLLNEQAIGQTIKREFFQRTFKQVDVRDVLDIAPGYKRQELEATIARGNRETREFMKQLGFDAAVSNRAENSRMTALLIKSFGGEIAVRDEEPMAKLGTSAVKVGPRILNIISESFEFMAADPNMTAGKAKEQIIKGRGDMYSRLIKDHPYLFKSGGDYSLMLQMGDNPILEQSKTLEKIRAAFDGKELGEIATISASKLNADIKTGITLDRELSISQARNLAESYGGGLNVDEFSKTILGLVDEKSGAAKVSDQMLLIQGPNGPMVIPSPKAMGFTKEKGFLRVPGSRKSFDDLEARVFETLQKGESAVKDAKSMLLDVYEDVEKIEQTRLQNKDADVTGQLTTLENKLSRLYQVAASNTLAKQGLFYGSTLASDSMAMSGRLRLQTHEAVGMFEVGLTEDGLKKMFAGGKLQKYGSKLPGTNVRVFDKSGNLTNQFRDMVERGEFYVQAYREPIASGRQMESLKVKLLKEKDLGVSQTGRTRKVDFSSSAFLHTSMVKFGFEGDFDKDSIQIFRLMSMDDDHIQSIHAGQKAQLEGILESLQGTRTSMLSESLGGNPLTDQTIKSVDDVKEMLNMMSNRGYTFDDSGRVSGQTGTSLRNFSLDSLVKIVEPKHLTPIIEAHFAGRSYVDLMMGHIVDIQSTVEGAEIVRQNFISRVGESNMEAIDELLRIGNSLFVGDGPGSKGGRFATYNYTDARNLTKYMFLKKAADASDQNKSMVDEFISEMLSVGKDFSRMEYGEQKDFMRTIAQQGEARHSRASALIDTIAADLLNISGVGGNAQHLSKFAKPETASLLHGLAEMQGEEKQEYAKHLAKRMIYSEVTAESTKDAYRNRPGEGMMKNLGTILRRLGIENVINMSALGGAVESVAAQSMTDIQGMSYDPDVMDVLNAKNMEQSAAAHQQVVRDSMDRMAIDAAGGELPPNVPNSSARNAAVSGEFFGKISQMKFFKPAAAIVGGLAGIEVIRSAIDRFTPGVTPTMGYASANTMPPPPMLSSPQDPTFTRDAMPSTNVARVARHKQQRSSVNISGKADNPIDFRGVVNSASLNNSYVPNIQGSFSSSINDTMTQVQMNQFVNDRMDSSF